MGGHGFTSEHWYPKQKTYGEKEKYIASWVPQLMRLDVFKIVNDENEPDAPSGGCLAGVLTKNQYERYKDLDKVYLDEKSEKRLNEFRKKHDMDGKCFDHAESLKGLEGGQGRCSFIIIKNETRKDPQRQNRNQVRLIAECTFRDRY